jgi:hypothetical protein
MSGFFFIDNKTAKIPCTDLVRAIESQELKLPGTKCLVIDSEYKSGLIAKKSA